MTLYTSNIQRRLIAELQNCQITELDFYHYNFEQLPPLSFSEHTEPATCITILSNNQVVSSSHDNTLRVWDVRTGRCLKILEGHVGIVNCVAVLSNSQIVSGSHDNTLRVWDVRTGECLKTLEGHRGAVNCVAVLPNGQVVSGSNDKSIQVWDLKTGECLRTMKGHRGKVNCVAVLPKGQIVSGSWDWILRVWDVSTGECLKTLEGHGGSISCVALLPNGQVVSGSWDNTLRIWDLSTGQCLKTLGEHRGYISCNAVLPDGQVVSGSWDNTLRVWDVRTGQCPKILVGHGGHVNCVAVLPNGQVMSGGSDKTFKCWTLFLGYSYDTIAPVLRAISPECGLRHLSLQGVYLGQVGYEHLLQLIQKVCSLKTLNLLDTDLTPLQIHTLNQIVRHHREQYQQRKAQTQAARDQLLQKQAERIGQLETQLKTTLQAEHDIRAQYQQQQAQAQVQAKRLQELETQMQRLQVQYVQQESSSLLTYPEITFTCPVIEQTYHRIEEESVPDEFLCPITRQIMWEPVMADDGYTYERDVIEAHFQRSVTSPMLPEEPLPSQRLVMNRNVRAAIQRLLERHPGWTLYQPDAVYFSSAYEVTVQAAITANNRAALLRAIDQEPRLLTYSLMQGLLIEQVWHQAELLEAVVQRLTPAMWSHAIQKAGGISHWLGKLAGLTLPSLASQLQGFTIFLQALQTGLSCEYPTKALIAQGLHQSLPVLLLLGLHRLSGINSSLDAQQNTALHYAAASGDLPLVTALVEQEATITLKNKAGQTPKALAQLAGYAEVVAYCKQAELQPLMSQLLANLGFLGQCQALREKVEQQQATILQLETQNQAQDRELQELRVLL